MYFFNPVCIFHKNHISISGYIVEPAIILSNIKRILKSDVRPAEFPVGVLTTENRDLWASARKHLESLGNSQVLDLIDSSLFNLSLDEVVLHSDYIKTVQLFLHADGFNRCDIISVLLLKLYVKCELTV